MAELLIATDRAHGEVDMTFLPSEDEPRLLEDLHDNVLPTVDGASVRGAVEDGVIAIRAEDFDDVVRRLAAVYEAKAFDVTVA